MGKTCQSFVHGSLCHQTLTSQFDLDEVTRARPRQGVPKPVVEASEDNITGVSGATLWGPLLNRLNIVDLGDEWGCAPSDRMATPARSACGR